MTQVNTTSWRFVKKLSSSFLISFFLIGCFENKETALIFSEKISAENLTWKKVQTFDSTAKVDSFFKSKNKTIDLLLEPSFDPYVGEQTVPEKCLVKNLPKLEKNETQESIYQVISLYSGKNKAFAQCSDPNNLLKTQYLLIYCKSSKTVFEVKYFYPSDLNWNLKPVATCG